MGLFSDLRFRLRAMFRRRAVEQELDEELRFHLEREAEQYVRDGMSPDDARRRARLAFGGVERIKDDTRDARGLAWLERLLQNLRYALRGMRGSPGFTAAVVLTLGLGIGANAAMFGIIDRLMFRAPGYLRDPAGVHRVYLFSIDPQKRKETVTAGYEYTRYLDLARWTSSFSSVAAFDDETLAVGSGADAREMRVASVSADYFDFFDAAPALGRFFTREEDTPPRGALVAVLSYPYWQTRYGGRPDVVGQSLQIGPAGYTVIGVAPRGFVGIDLSEAPVAFIPITAYAGVLRNGGAGYYTNYNWGWHEIMVRRKPGISAAQATADLTQAYRKSWEAERAMSRGVPPLEAGRPRALAGPLQLLRGPRGGAEGSVIAWTFGIALIVLVIACANVANLLLARTLRRRREIAVRLALGVSRGRLLEQLLSESLVLALLGGAAGLLLAQGGGAGLRALLLPEGTPAGVLGDGRTVAFAGLLALAAGLATGLAPLWHAGRDDLVTTLKAGAREGGARRSRTRSGLLLFQAALSVVLLVGAGLFVKSLANVRGMRLGFDVEPVLYVSGHARGTRSSVAERIALGQRLEEAARALPGVEAASRVLTVPFWDTWSQGLHVEGIDTVRKLGHFTLQGGSPDFFRTAGTRILRGRGIGPEDRAGAPLVLVVSEAMGRVLWPGQDPLGKCVRMNSDTMPCMTVVGIAENMRQSSLGPDDHQTQYYLPIEQFHPEDAQLYVRTRGPAAPRAEEIRRELQRLMPGASYLTALPLSEIVGQRQRSWTMGATMFVAFGGLALLLAALGLYSVIAYDVTQRRHELGVRVALGAGRGAITRLVVRQALGFVTAGLLLGGAVALYASRWVESLLFEQSPRDPLVFGTVAAVLLVVAVLASALPALRASRVDPNIALRLE